MSNTVTNTSRVFTPQRFVSDLRFENLRLTHCQSTVVFKIGLPTAYETKRLLGLVQHWCVCVVMERQLTTRGHLNVVAVLPRTIIRKTIFLQPDGAVLFHHRCRQDRS